MSLNKDASCDFGDCILPLTYIITTVVIIFAVVGIMGATSTLVSIIIAPKVYILKQILTSFK